MEGFNGISLADYADMARGASASGNFSQQDVEMLLKAMEAGQITGRETTDSTTASGAPLKVESLENTLKVLTNTKKHTPLFFRIGKKPATNTVEEFNQLVSYGGLEGGSLMEGELPENSDSVYVRKAAIIKYYGVVGGVTTGSFDGPVGPCPGVVGSGFTSDGIYVYVIVNVSVECSFL